MRQFFWFDKFRCPHLGELTPADRRFKCCRRRKSGKPADNHFCLWQEQTLIRQSLMSVIRALARLVNATHALNLFAGVLICRVSRGRSLSFTQANTLFSCSTNAAAATGSTRLRRVASSNRACSKGGSINGRATMSPGGISALPGLRNWKQTPRFM